MGGWSRHHGPVVRVNRSGFVQGLAIPMRSLAQRGAFAVLVTLAITLLFIGRVDHAFFNQLRAHLGDIAAPVLDAASRPVATVSNTIDRIQQATVIYKENQKLRQEVERLKLSQQSAIKLQVENARLRALTHVVPDPSISYITARVVANPGGGFVKTILVSAGARDGIKVGQAVLSEGGMIGRVVDVGMRSARILLITDLNARVPVLLENSRYRAILGGTNEATPHLLYLPPEARPVVGERVVTSGNGGLFPASIPVGIVASISEEGIAIQPMTDFSRLEYVQILDYELPGLLSKDLTDVPAAE